MFKNIKVNLRRYIGMIKNKVSLKIIFNLIFTQGIWAIAVYRFGSWCNKLNLPVISFILKFIYFFLNKIVEIIAGISISSNARIGKGLYIGHFGGIFINEGATVGENCSLGQGVTIGTLGLGKRGSPTLGNNVFIGAGAKILGKIKIGNNVRIGANAVVIKDAPDNATVIGVPGRIVRINHG